LEFVVAEADLRDADSSPLQSEWPSGKMEGGFPMKYRVVIENEVV
jgi:hypothetical protein